MSLATVILFLVASWGATQVLTVGRVFNAIRPNYYFFKCPMCIGFWVGAALSYGFFHYGVWDHASRGQMALMMFVCACAASAVSYLFVMSVNDDGLRVTTKSDDV